MANTPWRREGVKLEVDAGVEHEESASVPSSPAPNFGTYWVRDDSDNTPMFTSDDGTDYVLNQGAAWRRETNSTTGASATNTIATPVTALLDGDQTVVEVLIFGEESGDPTQTYFHRQLISYYRDGGSTTQWGVSVNDAEQRRGTFPTTLTTTLTTSGNDIIVNADTTGIVGTIDWTVLYLTRGSITNGLGGSTGSTSTTPITLWLPDVPPVTPDALDDEFAASTLGGAWTEWDVPGNLTVSFDEGRLVLTKASDAGTMSGIFQSPPVGSDWTIIAKVSLNAELLDFGVVGLFIAEDLGAAPSTGNLAIVELVRGVATTTGNNKIEGVKYNDYQTFGSSVGAAVTGFRGTTAYLRIRVSGSNYSSDYSSDGVTWATVHSGTSIGFTVGSVGVFSQNVTTGVSLDGYVEFFRGDSSSSSFTDVMRGRRVVVGGGITPTPWDTTVHVAAFTASSNGKYKFDASTFSGNISLPANPSNGDEVTLKNASSSTANVTLSGNGNNVEDLSTYSLAATATLSGDGAAFTYSFDGTQWLLI